MSNHLGDIGYQYPDDPSEGEDDADAEDAEDAEDADIDVERDDIVDRWHAGEYGDKPLHECLSMTEAEYAEWVSGRPKEDLNEHGEIKV